MPGHKDQHDFTFEHCPRDHHDGTMDTYEHICEQQTVAFLCWWVMVIRHVNTRNGYLQCTCPCQDTFTLIPCIRRCWQFFVWVLSTRWDHMPNLILNCNPWESEDYITWLTLSSIHFLRVINNTNKFVPFQMSRLHSSHTNKMVHIFRFGLYLSQRF